jgi:hypothetical protein
MHIDEREGHVGMERDCDGVHAGKTRSPASNERIN